MARDPSWQPRNEKGQFKATNLAEEAEKAGRSVKSLVDVAGQAGVSIDALAKAFKKIRMGDEAKRATDAAKIQLGQLTDAQKKRAKLMEDIAKSNDAVEFEPVTRPIEAFQKALRAAGPEGQAAAAAATMWAAALTAVGAALVKTIDFVTTLVSQMSLLRSQFMALAKNGPGAGAATLESLKRLGQSLPFATDKVVEWGKSLMMAKLQGKDLENAVKAVAGAAALMGDQGAAAAQNLFETLARGGMEAASLVQTLKRGLPDAQAKFADMGLRVEDVAKAMGLTVAQMKNARISARQMAEAIQKALATKAAGPLGEMMLSWPVLTQKVKEGFLSLFEKLGPVVKPFMKAIKELFGQFGRGTPAMKALQKVVTEVFGAIFKYGTMAVKAISKFVKENFTAKNTASAWNTVKGAIGKVAMVIGIAWAVFKKMWPVIRMVGGALLWVAGTIIGIVFNAFVGIVGLVGLVIDGLTALYDNTIGVLGDWASSAADAAGDFISGLVGGIAGGLGAVVSAASNLASGALGAFKSVLGIASPSKVMARMGGFAAEGAAQGVEQGADRVEGAASKLGGAVTGGAAKGMGKGAPAAKGGGMNVTFQDGAIRIDGAGKGALEITEEMLAAVLERLAAAQGLLGAKA